jgi:ferredoxin
VASPVWVVRVLERAFRRVMFLARLTRLPGLGRAVEHGFFGDDEMVYLPADRVIEVARPLETGRQTALPSAVVEEFIRRAGERWIMNECICRKSAGCADYPVELGCLFLGQAAAGINPRLARRVGEKEALEHVRRCREAGLVHLIGRSKLDALWLNVRPGRRLLTVCNCCPCCCLWRIIPVVSAPISEKVQRMPGVRVRVAADCTGCGICAENVCFAGAIRMEEGRAVIGPDCRGCGRCVEACPAGAIELSWEDGRSVESAVRLIEENVDVG